MNESHISCPKCGASLDSDSVFCKRCGTKLEIPSFCRKCGKALAPDMLFCPACGLPLYDRTEDPPDTPKPESRKAARAVLLSIIALSVVLLLAILWIYNRQSVFQKAIEDAGGKNHVGEWAVASGDGKSLRVDTNPADEPNFYDPDALSAIEKEFIQMARQNQVDGIIALTYNPRLSIPDDIPFVTIDRFFSTSVPCIASDNFGGGYLAAHKLKEQGCTSVAFMRIGSTLVNEPSKRKDGFVSACVEMGLPFQVMALEDGQPFDRFEEFLLSHMKDGKLEFDGLFIGTDSLAWQIIQILRKRNIRIPEDVQVIGFDGIRMFGDQEPVVSTIVQPVQEIAEACVSTVLSKHLSNVPSLICLPVSYAYGGTTRE